jgi:hypothetical protein
LANVTLICLRPIRFLVKRWKGFPKQVHQAILYVITGCRGTCQSVKQFVGVT